MLSAIKSEYKTIIISALFALTFINTLPMAFGQLINDEQSPPSVKWQQITTPDFNLIYPDYLYKDAQRTATFLKNQVDQVSMQYGIKPRKINIVFQSLNTEGNGYVQLAPRKSEFFITAPQEAEAGDWLQTLALHEYRHVVQMDRLTGQIRFPFEELGFAFFGISLPTWFYEGDAVLTETLLSKGGRGRTPSWHRNLRANLLEGNRFSYQKNYFGSYKDRTPGHYEMGYFLTTKMYRDYGPDLAENLLDRIAGNPLRPYNFSRSLKKLTGRNTREWHDQTMEELSEIWEQQQTALRPTDYPQLPVPPSRFPQHFAHPQPGLPGEIIALRLHPQKQNSIVLLDSLGRVTELAKTGRQASPHFSHSEGVLTWDEVQSDPRFKLRNFSVIHRYDMRKKEHRQLSRKSRFFGPVLSADARRIAVVEINLSNEKSLVILDAENGREIDRMAAPNNDMIASLSPQFSDEILAVNRNENGAGILSFNLQSRTTSVVLTPQQQEIESPQYAANHILFKAHYKGIDNLYLLEPHSEKISAITNVRYGAYDPYFEKSSQTLYFTNDDGRNLMISTTTLDSNRTHLLNEVVATATDYFKPLTDTLVIEAFSDSLTKQQFTSAPYKRSKHLLNFHSLSINNGDFSTLDDYKPGLFLLSNNIMNTLSAQLGATYDYDIHGLNYHAALEYKRYYPKLSVAYDNLERFSNIRHPRDSAWYGVRWRESETRFQVELPFSVNRLNWNYSINFRAGTAYTQRYGISEAAIEPYMIREIKFPMSYQLRLARNSAYSRLDLAPRWGQNITVALRHMPFSDTDGLRFGLQSAFFFPGLMPNHSAQLRYNVQHREGIYRNDNSIPMVSGYDQLRPSRPKNTFFIDYLFPLAYPDFEIGPLAYITRLKVNLSADFENFAMNRNFTPRTYSVQLLADMNVFRFLLPNVEVGVKSIYVNENHPERFIFQYSLQYSY